MTLDYARHLLYDKAPLKSDSEFQRTLIEAFNSVKKKKTHRDRDIVDHVKHNPPATIVFWKDKTKTVVKQQDGDVYDPEKGFMAACTKKFFGNDNQFNYEIKWHVPKQAAKDDVIVAESTNVEFGVEYTGPQC